MRREDRSSIVVSSSRKPRRGQTNYVIDKLLILLCAVPLFAPGGRSFVPALRVQTRRAQGAVKAGRRACLASRVPAARPTP